MNSVSMKKRKPNTKGRACRLMLGAIIALLLLTLSLLSACGEEVCTHEYGEWWVSLEPTCTQAGAQTHTCQLCGQSESFALPAKDHDIEIVPELSPTCQSEGYSSFAKCKSCNTDLSEKKVLPKTNHNVVSVDALEPTCTSVGKSAWSYCGDCNETIVEAKTLDAKGHVPVADPAKEATCLESGLSEGSHCDRCKTVLIPQQIIDAKGHTPVTLPGKEATCLASGLSEGSYCDRCKTVLIPQQIIDAKGHTPLTLPGKEPTCLETGLSEGAYCEECSVVLIEQQTLPLSAHATVVVPGYEAKCAVPGLSDGEHCTVCGKVTIEQEVIAALEHSYVTVVGYDATCREEGLTNGEKCKHCGAFSIEQEVIPKKDHAYTMIEANDPKCQVEGYKLFSCSMCGDKKREILEPLSHDVVTDKGRPATVSETGLSDGEHCRLCGAILKKQTDIPRLVIYTATVSDPRMGSVNITSQVMAPGERITLEATPTEGYGFLGWYYQNGACASNEAKVSLDVWDPDSSFANFNSVEARFYAKIEMRVTKSHLDAEITGEGYYSEGEYVTLTAAQNERFLFLGWYKNGVRVSVAQSYSFKMGQTAPEIEARFVAAYKLTLLYHSDLGSVSATNRSENGYVYEGYEVYLQASPTAEASFGGIYNGTTLLSSTQTYRFTMPSEDVTLEVLFTSKGPKEYLVVVSKGDSSATVSGEGSYLPGDIVTLKAEDDEFYRFVGWVDNATGQTVSTDASYSFIMTDKNLLLLAQYEKIVYRVGISTNYEQITISSPERDFKYGESVLLSAPVKDEYHFVGWFVNGELLGTNHNYYLTVSTNMDAIAKYAKYYSVDASVAPEGIAEISCPSRAYVGQTVLFTAMPLDAEQSFLGWFLGDQLVNTELAYETVMPEGDLTLEARFGHLYKITVVENYPGGGTYVAKTSAIAGERVTLTLTDTNSGYDFLWWYIDEEQNTSNREFTFTMPEHDLTVELRYQKKVKYTVSSNYDLFAYSATLPTYSGEAGYVRVENLMDETLRFDGFFINGVCVQTDTTYEFVAGDEDVEIVARFTQLYELVLESKNEAYKVYSESTLYPAGASVTIRADAPAKEHKFLGWYTGNGAHLSTELSFTFTMPESTCYIYALYETLYTVTVTVNAPSELVKDGEYQFSNGEILTLEAEEMVGTDYLFDGWYVNGERASNHLQFTFCVDGDMRIDARYWTVHTLTVIAPSGVVVAGEGYYIKGETAHLSFTTTQAGFLGWYLGEELISTEPTLAYEMPGNDVTLVAKFLEKWDGTVADSFAGGNGTSASPYLIANGAQLARLAKLINETTDNAYYNKYYRLTADIDLGSLNWTPIGTMMTAPGGSAEITRAFQGHFDGAGHTVYNLSISSVKAADYYYIGLFGCAINAEISDLNIQDATITANNCTLNVNVGTVAGRADSTTITRCTVDCTVSYCRASTKDFYIGGIVGRSYTGVVTDCVVQGSVRGVSTYENRIYLGGVIGYASEVSVSRCISGTVCYAESRETPIAGGVIGYMQEGSKIRACVSFGSGEAYCSGSYYSYADKICAYIKDTSSTATGCKNEITYTKAFFTSLGFEESVWNLDGVEGENLPSPIQN